MKTDRDHTYDELYPQVYEYSYLNIGGSYFIDQYTSVHLRYSQINHDVWQLGKDEDKTATKNQSIFLTIKIYLKIQLLQLVILMAYTWVIEKYCKLFWTSLVRLTVMQCCLPFQPIQNVF